MIPDQTVLYNDTKKDMPMRENGTFIRERLSEGC